MTSGTELAKRAKRINSPTPVVVHGSKEVQLYRIEKKGDEMVLVEYGKKLRDGDEITLVKICTCTLKSSGKPRKSALCKTDMSQQLMLAVVLDKDVDFEISSLQ